MQEFEIIFYETDTGEKPVKDFLDSLDVKMRAKMLLSVRIVREKGYQARIHQRQRIIRSVYFHKPFIITISEHPTFLK